MALLIQTGNSPASWGQIALPLTIVCSTPEETFALGKALAGLLEKGSIVALKGPLGAGKTCFAKGIANGLDVAEEITSASYTIISEYEAFLCENSICFYHIDAYRLEGIDDFAGIGGEEIIFGNGISVIEWSERIFSIIPDYAFRVDIMLQEEEKRMIHIYKG